jgi:hypothetical protein
VGHPVTGGHKYRDLVLQVLGLDTSIKNLLCARIIVTKSKEVKAECDLIESSMAQKEL